MQSISTVWISRNRSLKCTVLMRPAKWSCAGIEAPARLRIFPETAAMPGGHRGVLLARLGIRRFWPNLARASTELEALRRVQSSAAVLKLRRSRRHRRPPDIARAYLLVL
jgi:hypothetical protein